MSLCLYKLKNININDIAFKLYQPKDKKKYNIRCFNKKGQNIMTETIPLYCPYGINTKTLIQDTLQLTISLSSRLLHDNTEKFYDDMGDLEQHIVNNEDKFISNNYSCKSMSMISCIDDNDKLNVYTQDITKNTFKVYDNNNNIIGSKDIRSKSFVQCIFWLYGIWLNNDTYGLNWKLVQCKLYPDIFSIDKCLFFSDDYDMKEILYDYPKKIDNKMKKPKKKKLVLLESTEDSSSVESSDEEINDKSEEYEKYHKMLRLGIPENAVILECKKNGVNPKSIGIIEHETPKPKAKAKAKARPLPNKNIDNNSNKNIVSKIKPPSTNELKAQIALLKKTNIDLK